MALFASREAVLSAISALGYKCFRGGKFHWHSEKTPDSSVNSNGTIHRWTDGWHGDLIDFIRETQSMSFREAKKVAEELTNTRLENSSFEAWKPEQDKNLQPISEDFLTKFLVARRTHYKQYHKELKKLFSGKYAGQPLPAAKWGNIVKVAKRYQIGFSEKSRRLIMPIRNKDGYIMTFWKYRKNGNPKVLFSKGRSRPPFALADFKEFNKALPIVLTEGEKDALVALANGIQAICIGGAGSKIPEEYLPLFKGWKIILAGDYDKAGQTYNKRLAEQLKDVAFKVTIIDWEAKAYLCGFKLHDKFDLADYFAWKLKKAII